MRLDGVALDLLILDVDGVLVDIWQKFRLHCRRAARRFELPGEPLDQYFLDVAEGRTTPLAGYRDTAQRIWPMITPAGLEELTRAFREEERRDPNPACPGAIKAVQRCRDRGLPLALCTSNEREALLCRLGDAGFDVGWFVAMATGDDEFRKPDPRALDPIFARIPVRRESAVFVGDWYPDLRIAREAGLRFFAVLSGSVPEHAFVREGVPASNIFRSLADVVSRIEP